MRRGLLVVALLLASPGAASAATSLTIHVAPAVPVYGHTVVFSGHVTPQTAGEQVDLIADTGSGYALVTSTTTAAGGTYSFSLAAKKPGSYAVQAPGATSAAVPLTLRPHMTARVRGLLYPGLALYLRGRVRPAAAGTLKLHIRTHTWKVGVHANGTYAARLLTRAGGLHRARLQFVPRAGYAPRSLARRYRIRTPNLSIGSYGRAVFALERRLHLLHYALRASNKFFGVDTYEAVLAFQKVHRMSRTGRIGDTVWGKLGRAKVPVARHPSGSHIEVDKTRQVLFEVRRGHVVHVIHVSTGATGNTPVGTYHVYLKTPGLLPSGMYYSLFWHGAFAIHGYHSVPPWPASHGCVRIPMWLAPGLYSRWGLGTRVYVYYS